MRPNRRRAERTVRERRRPERGAALVEFALIAPILFAIVFGIVDFGVAYNDWIALRQGAREGARQAVTGRVGSDVSCPIQSGSPTFPADTKVNELVCLVKDRTGLPKASTAVKLLVEGTYTDKRSLSVCVMSRLSSTTGLFGTLLNNRVVHTKVQMKIEQTVAEATGTSKSLAAWQESALTGGSWGACTIQATV
jgi:TadE-like protein